MVAEVSLEIRRYIICILHKSLFEEWDKMMMALEQQSTTPEFEFDKIFTIRLSRQSFYDSLTS